MPASSLPRNCAESCLDFLLLELVHKYTTDYSDAKAVATLEAIGRRVGKQLVERSQPPILLTSADSVDVMKFLCKEFWTHVFQKQVDNLKTNHRGVYVLQDTQFRWMAHIHTSNTSDAETPARTRILQQYLALPCGLIEGALKHLGVNCIVTGDAIATPLCSFTIKIL